MQLPEVQEFNKYLVAKWHKSVLGGVLYLCNLLLISV